MSRYVFCNPVTGEAEARLVAEVLAGNYLNEGAVAEKFEAALSSRVGCKHAILTTNCTSALYLCLLAHGVGPGDEVLVPDLTFIATANAVSQTGATPVLVDVEPESLNMSVAAARRAITTRTKAILPVHVSGRGADLAGFSALAKEHKLHLIEDAAEALLSRSKGKMLGTVGAAGCVSFSPNKTITTGQGGAIFTNDDDLAVSLRQLKDQGRPARGTGGDDLHPVVGFNFKTTNLQAAVGLGQLESLDEHVATARRINRQYREMLDGVGDLQFYAFDLEGGEVPQWTDISTSRRNELHDWLRARDIHGRKYWHPLHTQPAYRRGDEEFPESTRLSPLSYWLPSAYTLTTDDVEHVSKVIREFFNNI